MIGRIIMNNYFAIGRLTKDIDLKYTRNNKPVAIFTVAITRPYKNNNGDYESDFINCEMWGKIAETMKEYTKKGDQIGIAGTIRTETYKDKDNNTKFRSYILVDQVKFLSYNHKEEKINNSLPEDNLDMPF